MWLRHCKGNKQAYEGVLVHLHKWLPMKLWLKVVKDRLNIATYSQTVTRECGPMENISVNSPHCTESRWRARFIVGRLVECFAYNCVDSRKSKLNSTYKETTRASVGSWASVMRHSYANPRTTFERGGPNCYLYCHLALFYSNLPNC